MFEAQLARAESLLHSKRPGQRADALTALRAAAKIKVTSGLRAAAIAALAETDMRVNKSGPPRPRGNSAFAFAPDLETTVTERQPGVLEWWTGQEGPMRTRLDASAAGRVISQPTFSPDGRFLLTRHADNSVHLWLVSDGREIAVLAANAPAEPALAFDCAWRPDSQEFAISRAGGGLTFHSADDGHETRRWENALAPELVRLSRDGAMIAVALGRKIAVLNAATLVVQSNTELEDEARIIDWHPDSKKLAVGCRDGRIRVLDAAHCALQQEFIGHRNSILSFGYFPHGELAISFGKDTATRLWDTRTGDTLVILSGLGGTGVVEFSPDGTRAGLSGIDLCGVIVEVTRPAAVRERAATRPRDTGSLIGALDFNRDGSLLAIATWGGIEVIDFASARVLASFPEPEDKREESSAIFAPDGSALYTGNAAHGLRRHRARDGGGFEAGELLDAEPDWLVADIAPDGAELVLVNREKGEVKFAGPDGKTLRTFAKHPNAMFAALSPDRKWLATQGSGRGESSKLGARVWSLGDESLAREFATGPLEFVSFSPDGRWLGAAGVKGFELVRAGDWTPPHPGLPAEVANSNGAIVSFAADGELAAVTVNEKVYVVDPSTGAEKFQLASPSGNSSTARVRLSPDGLRLAVMWDDASFDLWDLAELRDELAALGIEH
ncbi:MAG: WD40 repeat domain-containing protein [Acidobacteria bacterium]|nr:WD40 repeat domain-containing protein [Acidobacteriota bacterium]